MSDSKQTQKNRVKTDNQIIEELLEGFQIDYNPRALSKINFKGIVSGYIKLLKKEDPNKAQQLILCANNGMVLHDVLEHLSRLTIEVFAERLTEPGGGFEFMAPKQVIKAFPPELKHDVDRHLSVEILKKYCKI